jgi:hypothetical protein
VNGLATLPPVVFFQLRVRNDMASGKIASTASIKSFTKEVKGVKVSFKDLLFTASQADTLSRWIEERRQVKVTIEPTEKLLTDDEGEVGED